MREEKLCFSHITLVNGNAVNSQSIFLSAFIKYRKRFVQICNGNAANVSGLKNAVLLMHTKFTILNTAPKRYSRLNVSHHASYSGNKSYLPIPCKRSPNLSNVHQLFITIKLNLVVK